MGKQNVHFQHFSVGEYSSAGQARVDEARTRLAADVQENIFSHAVGRGQVRPGTTYIGSTPNNERVRLIPFVRDIDDVALIEMSAARMRVWVNDALVTRATVDSTVTNGDFSSSTGWTLSASSGAHATISGGVLTMDADARGSEAYCERSVTTNDAGTEHALDIVVTRGPVLFRCGSSSGAQDYIYETRLDTGYHSLAFTPTGTYYVRLITRNQRDCVIDSIQVAAAGVMTLTAPWSETNLREISFDQSADVIFLACADWQQRKIERRGTTSWSLAIYQSDDGPFVAAPDGVSVTPSGTHGNVTLTANASVFTSAMVGGLVRLYHDRLNQTVQLAGGGEFTDIFTIRGIKGENFNDRTFSYSTSGTWSGTMRLQRSLTGTDGDFLDYNYDDGTSATTFTTNKTVTHVGQQDDNNIISYMRIGFIDGAYTSGTATVNVQYSGFSGYGVARITGYNSPTSVSIEVLEPFNSASKTYSWELGGWSDYNGWPSAVALFDGRLWWGGRDTFWGSASDAYYSFDDLETTDSATIQRQVATGGQVSQINWFLPLQRLLIGTTGSIVSARSPSFDEPLTPGGITVKDAATIGGSYVSPVKIDSRGAFVHRSGDTLQTMLYSVDNQDYTSKDMNGMNRPITDSGIVELAVAREPDTFIWSVMANGQVAILIYEYAENMGVEGWSRFVTNGVVESVCTLPGDTEDAVYLAVDRTNEEEVIYTGAEELASVATGDVAAWDFTDQSVYVVDATTPANDVNSQGQTDGWGGLSGPNANVASSTALNASNPKLLRQSSGLLAFQPHNYVTYSEALEEDDWGKYKVWISPEMFEAPDGTMTARKVIEQGGASGYHMWSIPIAGIPIYSLVELTFWAKPLERTVLKAGYGLNHAVGSASWLNNYDYVEDYLYLDTGLPLDDYVFAWSYPYEPYSGDYSDFGGNGALTSEDAGDGWYRYSLKLLTGNADSMVYFRMYNQSESSFYVGDDSSGLLLWGVQVNRIPVIETQQGQMSRYVKTEGSALMTMPYQWTSAGVLEGMRVEPDGQTYLPCGKNFNDFYTKSNSTIGWAYAGEDLYYPDLDPTQVPEAATFTESGSGVVPHYIERVFVGPDGYWDLSIHVKTIDAPFIGLSLITPENDYYFVNFSTGTGEMTLESVSAGITITDYGVESYALGWSRVWIMANITVSLPGVMRSQGTSTASFVSLPQPAATMAGTSTASWGGVRFNGDGAISASGSSTASFVDDSTYPASALLGNLGFEDTNANFSTNTYTYTGLAPWEIIQPSRFGFYSGGRNGVSPIEGRSDGTRHQMIYDLGTGTTATDAEIQQTGTLLTSGVTGSQIDAGEVYFSFWGYTADDSINTPTANQARVIIEYLNASQTLISNALDTGWYAHSVSDVWEQYSVVNNQVPSGARFVRVRLFARNNNTGGFSNFGAGIYFDAMSYELVTDASGIQMIYNGSFEVGSNYTATATSTTTAATPFDWTRVAGSNLCYFYNGSFTPPNSLASQDGGRYIQGGTTNLELRQDVTLLDRYAGLLTGSDIDAETVTFDFSGYMANSFTLDTGRILVEFRDSGGTVISTAYDTGTIEITPTLTWTQKSVSAVDVPANTRIISFRLFVNLVSGTYANVNFDNLTASLTITPIPSLTVSGTATATFSGQDATPTAQFVSAGTSTVSFGGESTSSADLGASGTSTMTFYDAYNGNATMTTAGTSTVAFDVPPVGAMTSAGTATMSFKNKTTDGTVTEAGTSTASFSGAQANTNAIMRVYITDSAEPSLDSHGRPVHESTGLKTLIWGAQLEAGRLRPSSYIPTSWDGTGGSRSGDVYNTPLTNVPWDETQATLYVEAYQYDALASGSLGSENTGPAFGVDSGGDDVHFLRSDTSGDLRYEIINNGTVEASIDGGTWTLDTAFELASSAMTNDARLVVDGGSAVADTSLTMPTIPQSGSFVVFGHSDDGTYSFDGIIKRALLIPATSTTAELQVIGDPVPPPDLRFIEKLNLRSEARGDTITKMADAGIFAEGPVSSVTASWLAERTNLVGWGTHIDDGLMYPLTGLSADTSGVIALGGTYLNVFVGLGYTAKYKTGKLAHGAYGGTALLQRKRIGELALHMQHVHRDAVSYGADFDTLRKMSLIKDGKLQSATTVYTIHDEIGFAFPGYWDTDSRICLQVSAPYPCTFLGLVISVETNERGLGTG